MAERVAQLGCEAVTLEVPMQVDLKFGRSWGDAKHTWEELHGSPEPKTERQLLKSRRRSAINGARCVAASGERRHQPRRRTREALVAADPARRPG